MMCTHAHTGHRKHTRRKSSNDYAAYQFHVFSEKAITKLEIKQLEIKLSGSNTIAFSPPFSLFVRHTHTYFTAILLQNRSTGLVFLQQFSNNLNWNTET